MKHNTFLRLLCVALVLCTALALCACPASTDGPGTGETPGGETPGGETPGGETPGGETPGGETPGGETPGGETPGGETPGGETPGGETPGGETPGGETPGGETPGTNPEPTPTLTITPSEFYVTEGVKLTFTVSGEGYDADALTFTPSDATMLSSATHRGNTYTGKTAKTGELTVTATSGELSASCTVFILPEEYVAAADDPLIRYLGRTEMQGDKMLMHNTATGFEIKFYGTSVTLKMWDDRYLGSIFAVFLDGEKDPEAYKINLMTDLDKEGKITVVSFDEPGVHTLRLQKTTEEQCSKAGLIEIAVEGGALVPYEPSYTFKMEVYGDSIMAGFGNLRKIGEADSHYPQNGLLSFSALAASALDAEYRAMVQSGIGLSTCLYGFRMSELYDRVTPLVKTKWDMTSWIPDLVVIDLGSNDLNVTETNNNGFKPFDAEVYKACYLQFVRELHTIYGDDTAFILCSGVGPNTQGILTPLVAEIAAELRSDGISVYEYVLPSTICDVPGHGHPYVYEHEEASYGLIDKICEALDMENPYR